MFNPVISPLIHIAGFNIYPMRGYVAFFSQIPAFYYTERKTLLS